MTLPPPEYYDALRAISQPIRAAALPHTLDHVRRLLDALGKPQQRFRSVVVTGSTGKGTTCLRLASALSQGALRQDALSRTGLKVGLYTSPHLHSFRERFAILSASEIRLISPSEFVEMARPVLEAARVLDWRYSTFEYATAVALSWFARQTVDIAVLEVGIGGRFDAVNAVANELALFTPIEAEHVAMLGGSLESVAWHKAGIIQPNGSAITVSQLPAVISALERQARDQGASLAISDDLVSSALAHLLRPRPDTSAPTIGEKVSPLPKSPTKPESLAESVGTGSRQSPAPLPPLPVYVGEGSGVRGNLPGRLERFTVAERAVIIDGGHTPVAARHLRAFIASTDSIRLIFGMLRDKDAAAYLGAFDAPNVHIVYTRAPGDRALTPDDLLARFQPKHASVTLVPSLDEALNQVYEADESLCVVAGSLRMAAAAREAFGLLSADEREEARLTRAIFEGKDYQKKLDEKKK